MKHILLSLIATLLGTTCFANLQNSSYSPRHQQAIRTAIKVECGFEGIFKQESSKVEAVSVDQGITDYSFTTVLTYAHKIDQGVFDHSVITVYSHLSDMYDHEANDWGTYSVISVKCESL